MLPLQPARSPSDEGLHAVRQVARVPLWVPWPLPAGWLVTGFADAGDDRSGARACAVALSGPAILGGPADMLLIAEEPGVGMGAFFAGLPGPAPGSELGNSAPHAKVEMHGHPISLWTVDTKPDRAVYVGEAMGNWLWAVLWPAEAGLLLLGGVRLNDLRDPDLAFDLPYGAFCPRLGG